MKLSPLEREALEELAEADGLARSAWIRRAINRERARRLDGVPAEEAEIEHEAAT